MQTIYGNTKAASNLTLIENDIFPFRGKKYQVIHFVGLQPETKAEEIKVEEDIEKYVQSYYKFYPNETLIRFQNKNGVFLVKQIK